jgi:hypothetical protein
MSYRPHQLIIATLMAVAAGTAVAADVVARVISRTAITQQVGVPREACATYSTPGVPPQCSTQTIYEDRLVGFNVVYERGGKRYTVQLPQDPGPTLRLQASANVAAVTPPPTARSAPAAPVTVAVVPADPVAASDDPGLPVDDLSAFNRTYAAPVQVTYAYPGYVTYYESPGYWGPVVGLGFVGGYYGGRGRVWHQGHRR